MPFGPDRWDHAIMTPPADPTPGEGRGCASEASVMTSVRDPGPCDIRRVSIGGVSKRDLLARLSAAGVQLNDHARDLVERPDFIVEADGRIVEVGVVTVAELGHATGATMPILLQAARDRGFDSGPPELALHLRLQMLDQREVQTPSPIIGRAPPGSITVALRPFCDDGSVPRGFYLRRVDGELWLRGYRSDDSHLWSPEDRFAFVVA